MGGKNDSLKRKAFFRSLLAFHEEGLYEVPYIQNVVSCTVTRCVRFVSDVDLALDAYTMLYVSPAT
jgi:hypothetical protein